MPPKKPSVCVPNKWYKSADIQEAVAFVVQKNLVKNAAGKVTSKTHWIDSAKELHESYNIVIPAKVLKRSGVSPFKWKN